MPQKESMTIVEFKKQFATDEACRDRLYKIRWPEGLICPHCEEKEFYKINKRNVYECKGCRRQISLTAGTIMHGSHMPLHKWFWAVFLIAQDKHGISAMQLKRELEITYGTAWLMLRKIRRIESSQAMEDRDSRYYLAGIAEMDKTYISGSPEKDKRRQETESTSAGY